MYQRQWFSPDSQEGLTAHSLEIESIVRHKNHGIALQKIIHCIEACTTESQKYFWERQYIRVKYLEDFHKSRNSDVSIWFENFWPGFNPCDNELLNLLNVCGKQVGLKIKLNQGNPDLIIGSCFFNKNILTMDKATRILYLGENVRPMYSFNDYSLSFDLDSYMGRNIYLPLWFLRGTEFAALERDYDPYDIQSLYTNSYNPINKKEKVVYVGNNMTPLRKIFIETLMKNGIEVDIYGSQTGNPVQNKIKTMEKYRYSLCFENSYHPGYITEKLLDGYCAATIPIYWGGITNTLFNQNKFIKHHSEQPIQKTIDNLKYFDSTISGGLIIRDCYEELRRRIIHSLTRILFDLFVI